MKLIDDNFEILKQYGFTQSKVSIFPKHMIKVVDVDKMLIVEVCNDLPRDYNTWTGLDWKDVGIFKLWKCKLLQSDKVWSNKEVDCYYELDRTCNEMLKEYISDLIADGKVV